MKRLVVATAAMAGVGLVPAIMAPAVSTAASNTATTLFPLDGPNQ